VAAKLPPEEDQQLPHSTDDSFMSTNMITGRAGDQPDADDSDDEGKNIDTGAPRNEASAQASTDPVILHVTEPKENSTVAPKNRPFTCCIQQYGVQMQEHDKTKADAGDGKRWQRVFSIFGTTIQ
jgi:protection-of-telomeres protein 1